MRQCQVTAPKALNVLEEARRLRPERHQSFIAALPGSLELLNDQIRVTVHSEVNDTWLEAVPAGHDLADFVLANGQGINDALILCLIIGMFHSDKATKVDCLLLAMVYFGSLDWEC